MAFAGEKHLVVFGSGYVGGALARQAKARGCRVTALTRNTATAAELRQNGVEVIVADLAASDWHPRIGDRPDWVVNTVSSGGGGAAGYQHSYLDGMRSIVAWATAIGAVDTMVYTSSTSVYPQGEGVRVDESAAAVGGGERAEILQATEAIAQAATGAWRRFFILRLAGIYGPGRHYLLDQVRTGSVAGEGAHRLNLIHRDDVCAAIWAALAAPVEVGSDVFNVADDSPAPKAEVVAWLAARLGVAPPTFTGLPAGGRRAVTPDRVVVNAKLRACLGWTPRYRDFRAGYENVLAAEAE